MSKNPLGSAQNSQNKFVEIAGNCRAWHSFHKSMHTVDSSLLHSSSSAQLTQQFVATERDSSYQFEQNVHQPTLSDRRPKRDLEWCHHYAHPPDSSVSFDRNSKSWFEVAPAACPQMEDTTADRMPACRSSRAVEYFGRHYWHRCRWHLSHP